MPRNPRISFATLSIVDGVVLAQRRRRREPRDPRHPARELTPSEIRDWIADGDDGLLWGAFDIPVYHNVPLDASNRETIDSELSMSPDSPSPNARRDDQTLYVKVFDDEDERGDRVEYDDPARLPRTEEYSTMASIAERLAEYHVLNDEDFSEREWAYALERLESRCRDVVRSGSRPDWPAILQAWLARNYCQWDENEDYAYETGDVVRGLVDLGLMDPDAIRDGLAPEAIGRLKELDGQIRDAERQWGEMSRRNPAAMERFRSAHEAELAAMQEARTRLLFDDLAPPASPPEGQLELEMDEGSASRNRSRNERADSATRDYLSRLRAMLDAAAEELGGGFDPSAGDDSLAPLASSRPQAGREKGGIPGNIKEGKRRVPSE